MIVDADYNTFNPFPKQALVFTCLKYKSLENTVGKGEIARNEQFLLFPQFSTCLENIQAFRSKLKCRLQTLSVWKSLKFVVWEWVNTFGSEVKQGHCGHVEFTCNRIVSYSIFKSSNSMSIPQT